MIVFDGSCRVQDFDHGAALFTSSRPEVSELRRAELNGAEGALLEPLEASGAYRVGKAAERSSFAG